MTKEAQSLVLLMLVGLVVGGLTLWRFGMIGMPAQQELPAGAIASSAAPPTPAPPGIQFPIGEAVSGPLSSSQIAQALAELVGRDGLASFFYVDEFPRRFVATVDNLGRAHAPPLLWPVKPAPDRFLVDESTGAKSAIALDNAARYTPFVLLAESVDTRRAVELYTRMYPLLQRAYEELGFPKGYFNDRLIAILDLLLATPQPDYPVPVQLMEVKGPIASLRPWVRYEFTDPALESLSAGQKILVRMGPVNQRRLKAKLAELRDELARRAIRR
jgi:hypothetical protein